jgi:hypothetical protein
MLKNIYHYEMILRFCYVAQAILQHKNATMRTFENNGFRPPNPSLKQSDVEMRGIAIRLMMQKRQDRFSSPFEAYT